MKTLKMNKIAIIVAFLLINVFTASSQIRFGLTGGFDVASSKLNKDILNAKNRLGFQVGPTMSISLPLVGLGVDASLLYGYKEYKIDNDEAAEVVDLSNYNYLMLPVNLKKTFSLLGTVGVFIKGGPFAELKLSGGNFKFIENSIDDIKSKSFGVGLNFGAGVTLFSKLEVGMTYRFKFTDNYSDSDINVLNAAFKQKKDKTWNVNLAYYF